MALFAVIPTIGIASPYLALPALTQAFGADGWASVAVGQSIGLAVSVPVELGWGLVGPQPRLTLGGVSTDCCIIATALPAADAGATIRVPAAACAGSTLENHAAALQVMALFGPQIVIC